MAIASTVAGNRDRDNLDFDHDLPVRNIVCALRYPSEHCGLQGYTNTSRRAYHSTLSSSLLQPLHLCATTMADLYRSALQARFAKAPQLPPLPAEDEEEDEAGDSIGSLPTGMGPPAAYVTKLLSSSKET